MELNIFFIIAVALYTYVVAVASMVLEKYFDNPNWFEIGFCCTFWPVTVLIIFVIEVYEGMKERRNNK